MCGIREQNFLCACDVRWYIVSVHIAPRIYAKAQEDEHMIWWT